MSKKVIVLSGSPRKQGNSDRLADAFINGALQAGNEAEKIYVKDLRVSGCLGCLGCQRNIGKCVQKDDMQAAYDKVLSADVIVFAFPVYYYTWNAQMKTVLDRFYAIESLLKNKTFYMLASCAAPSMEYEEPVLEAFRKYISCFRAGGNQEGGYVFAFNTINKKDVEGSDAIQTAFQMGENI